jgi:hypothetical protein
LLFGAPSEQAVGYQPKIQRHLLYERPAIIQLRVYQKSTPDEIKTR